MFHRCLMVAAATIVALGVASPAVVVAQKEAPQIERLAKVFFEDEFEGDGLKEHWEVVNPDPERFAVEDGALLTVAKAVGGLKNPETPNLFRLKKELPAGDWAVTLKINAELQTNKEQLSFSPSRPPVAALQIEQATVVIDPFRHLLG